MSEPYLTLAEIEAKYPSQWVLLDQPTSNRYDEVTGGCLVLHDPDMDQFHRRMMDHRRPHMAALYVFGPADYAPDHMDAISVWTDDSTPG